MFYASAKQKKSSRVTKDEQPIRIMGITSDGYGEQLQYQYVLKQTNRHTNYFKREFIFFITKKIVQDYYPRPETDKENYYKKIVEVY